MVRIVAEFNLLRRMNKIVLSFLILITGLTVSFGQTTWSLEKCIQYALENNLTIKQADYGVLNAALGEKQAKASRLPNVSGQVNGGYQFGRTIDPTSNTFKNQSIGFNSFSVNAGAILYGGNRVNNSIKKSAFDLRIAKLQGAEVENSLALNIANAYLAILLTEEQLTNAKKQLILSNEQLAQTDKLIDAGVLPRNNRLDFVSKVALDEQGVIEFENKLASSYLGLAQLLQLPSVDGLKIEVPDLIIPEDANPALVRAEDVYQIALQQQPQIEAAELGVKSAEVAVDISKAATIPQLSIFGGLSSNYSTAAKDFEHPDLSQVTVVENTPQPVIFNGVNGSLVTFSPEGIVFPDKKYGTQLTENFGQNVGLSLRIPIYSNSESKIALERARINVLQQQVLSEQKRQALRTEIQAAVANARAGAKSYEAAKKSEAAANVAYESAIKRYELGAINTFDFSTARNNLDRAKINLIQTKFQYVFYLKVIDFYLGKDIKF